MRFTAIIVAAVSVAAAHAAVVSELADKREADPWCLFHGEGCWKRDVAAAPAPIVAKREAAPVAEADPWCLFHGEGCWKREAEPEAVADPEAWCLFHGEGCWKEKREAAPVPAPAADPEADPWCLFHGEGCWKEKREAAPAPEADPEAWCLFHGEGCWKVKRAVYAFANAIRGAAGIPESRSAEISNMRGGAAYNAKRAVQDIATMMAGRTSEPPEFLKQLFILEHFGPDANITAFGPPPTDADAAPISTDDDSTTTKRDADAEPWCLFHGEGCWKRSEEAGSSAATSLATRDASPAAAAFCPFEGSSTCYASKRDFAAADKRACNQPGEACYVARCAAEAIVTEIASWAPAKRSAEAVAARWCLFHGEGCWKRDAMDDVVARCNADDGACSQARRDLGLCTPPLATCLTTSTRSRLRSVISHSYPRPRVYGDFERENPWQHGAEPDKISLLFFSLLRQHAHYDAIASSHPHAYIQIFSLLPFLSSSTRAIPSRSLALFGRADNKGRLSGEYIITCSKATREKTRFEINIS
uniref:Mating type 1 pheromone n=1 Tax=Cryphonectria parasitica TaxID=5116 RepID=O14430_CRYPA|nr:mating type 1 pheromone precursor [Cryphonectria parasitica]